MKHAAPAPIPATVGQVVVDTLVANHIDRVFCVAGESYLGLLDALHGRSDIDTVVCHEAGARTFLERWNLPAVVSFRNHDLLPNRHRLYAGDLGLANPPEQMAVMRSADLVLALGSRLGDGASDRSTASYER